MFLLLCLSSFGKELVDVEFARPGGVVLKLDAWIPEGSRGAVVLVHGGGWEAGDKRTYIGPWFATFKAAGIAWFSIDYRLAPKHPHPAAVEDIEAAVRWVQKYGIASKRMVLMGESAGGHLAALVALRGRVKVAGLVSFYGIHDLVQWKAERGGLPRNISLYLPGVDEAGLREASPVSYLKRGGPQMLLVHGKADTGVPYAQSVEFCRAAKKVGVSCGLQLIEGAPHGVENWEKEERFQVWKAPTVEWLRGITGR